jgi:hypothetical protein
MATECDMSVEICYLIDEIEVRDIYCAVSFISNFSG